MPGRLNVNYKLKDSGYSNYENTTDLPRHRWYYYKEGFSPFLVEKAIEEVGIQGDDIIIDPFNGSGTTTLTASLNGYKSVGIEVNPFTSFLSSAKTKNANIKDFQKWQGHLLHSAKGGAESLLTKFSTFTKSKNKEKWLFNPSVLRAFEGGWSLTKSIPSYNLRKLTRIALISSAMQNCNAKKDGKCLKYREHWSDYNFNKDSFLYTLEETLGKIITDIEQNPIDFHPRIINDDCRTALKNKDIPFFKLCITSPPYLNTFDYTDIYRPELFLGKFILNPQHLYNLRLNTVRSHIQAKWELPKATEFGGAYSEAMAHINKNLDTLMHKDIPIMIQAYFEDMLQILKGLKKKALDKAELWLIVSNSAYADKEIPVDLILADVGTQAGWYLKEIGVIRYIKRRKTLRSPNVKLLRESVIIFTSSIEKPTPLITKSR